MGGLKMDGQARIKWIRWTLWTAGVMLCVSMVWSQSWWDLVDEDQIKQKTLRVYSTAEEGKTFWRYTIPWPDKRVDWARAWISEGDLTPYLIFYPGNRVDSHGAIGVLLQEGETYSRDYPVMMIAHLVDAASATWKEVVEANQPQWWVATQKDAAINTIGDISF